jgi:polyisoprenoid-binding protein YceI
MELSTRPMTDGSRTAGFGHRVHGTVSSADDWPLPGVTVTALGNAGEQLGRVVTDAAGLFEVNVPGTGGQLTLVVAGPGLRPYARAVRLGAPGVDVGRIVLGDPTSGDRPASGNWQIDPAHTIVKATARHLGLTRVEGRFVELSGQITVGETMQRSRVEVSIVAASLTTGNADRDAHLRSADFLDVERFPELTFRSTSVSPGPADGWQVDGVLSIRDISRPVTLALAYAGSGADPWGGTRAAFSATTTLNRRDYEMNWNMGLPGGMLLVGPALRIDLDVQAVLDVG